MPIANASVVRTADATSIIALRFITGIALACVDDADARLRGLLETVIYEVAPAAVPVGVLDTSTSRESS